MQTATSHDAPQGVRQVDIGPERDGQRIDNALATLLKGVPKSMIYRLLRTGQVRVNGKRAKPDTRLTAGDRLRIPPVRTGGRPAEPGHAPQSHDPNSRLPCPRKGLRRIEGIDCTNAAGISSRQC